MKEKKLIPVTIRPQLVPFLFREFEGNKASYEYLMVKSVVFLPSSSITSYLYTQINYHRTIKKQDKFVFYLSINNKIPKQFKGEVYIDRSGTKELLMMEEQKVREFNNLLEDMFRVSMIFYIDACLECDLNLTKSFEKFIDKYDLLEVGFDMSALRRLYYREKKTPKLFRFQSKSANNVINYL